MTLENELNGKAAKVYEEFWRSQQKGSPKFYELLEKCAKLHSKKAADYSQEGNPFSNFERSAVISSWFNNDIDKVYIVLISIKLARLAELLNGKEPKNESIEDSFIDLINYCALWAAKRNEHPSAG